MKNGNHPKCKLFAFIIFLSLLSINCSKQSTIPIPSLKEQGTSKQLIVDGKPFIALCGELTNNAATSL